MDATVLKYLRTRATVRPVDWARNVPAITTRVVVVPAYEESRFLPDTLKSLADCTAAHEAVRTVVIVVVNNPVANDAEPSSPLQSAFQDNQRTLHWLREHAADLPLCIGSIDASSNGRELPGKGGVGMARRIGCDTALQLIAEHSSDRADDPRGCVILNLDADAHVEPTYLDAADELAESDAGGGAILFEHQPAATTNEQYAIDCYELYMHHYVLGLRLAESPYAFHTVGSTMVAEAHAYAKCGGIPRKRLAGEDFYFMQNLARTCGVRTLESTVVHPSARPSQRVPFGTGPRINAYLDGTEPDFTVHHPDTFELLRQTRLAACSALLENRALHDSPVARLHPEARSFLLRNGFESILTKFRQQFAKSEQRIRAFDTWFDGLATFRLVRHLTETTFPPMPLLEGWRQLLKRVGLPLPTDAHAELLHAWRQHLRHNPTTQSSC